MKTYRLGLTGSIGMGKSTTAALFREAGIEVWDADATVHALYGAGTAVARQFAQELPAAMEASGAVSRAALRKLIAAQPELLSTISALVHPHVAASRRAFIQKAHSDIVLLDIPLLYETGAQAECDAVAVVTAPAKVQRARVLARPDMDDERFAYILSRQMPDADKRARADYVIQTLTLARARRSVAAILRDIRHKQKVSEHARNCP